MCDSISDVCHVQKSLIGSCNLLTSVRRMCVCRHSEARQVVPLLGLFKNSTRNVSAIVVIVDTRTPVKTTASTTITTTTTMTMITGTNTSTTSLTTSNTIVTTTTNASTTNVNHYSHTIPISQNTHIRVKSIILMPGTT